jgi:hypothetical protein
MHFHCILWLYTQYYLLHYTVDGADYDMGGDGANGNDDSDSDDDNNGNDNGYYVS